MKLPLYQAENYLNPQNYPRPSFARVIIMFNILTVVDPCHVRDSTVAPRPHQVANLISDKRMTNTTFFFHQHPKKKKKNVCA